MEAQAVKQEIDNSPEAIERRHRASVAATNKAMKSRTMVDPEVPTELMQSVSNKLEEVIRDWVYANAPKDIVEAQSLISELSVPLHWREQDNGKIEEAFDAANTYSTLRGLRLLKKLDYSVELAEE